MQSPKTSALCRRTQTRNCRGAPRRLWSGNRKGRGKYSRASTTHQSIGMA